MDLHSTTNDIESGEATYIPVNNDDVQQSNQLTTIETILNWVRQNPGSALMYGAIGALATMGAGIGIGAALPKSSTTVVVAPPVPSNNSCKPYFKTGMSYSEALQFTDCNAYQLFERTFCLDPHLEQPVGCPESAICEVITQDSTKSPYSTIDASLTEIGDNTGDQQVTIHFKDGQQKPLRYAIYSQIPGQGIESFEPTKNKRCDNGNLPFAIDDLTVVPSNNEDGSQTVNFPLIINTDAFGDMPISSETCSPVEPSNDYNAWHWNQQLSDILTDKSQDRKSITKFFLVPIYSEAAATTDKIILGRDWSDGRRQESPATYDPMDIARAMGVGYESVIEVRRPAAVTTTLADQIVGYDTNRQPTISDINNSYNIGKDGSFTVKSLGDKAMEPGNTPFLASNIVYNESTDRYTLSLGSDGTKVSSAELIAIDTQSEVVAQTTDNTFASQTFKTGLRLKNTDKLQPGMVMAFYTYGSRKPVLGQGAYQGEFDAQKSYQNWNAPAVDTNANGECVAGNFNSEFDLECFITSMDQIGSDGSVKCHFTMQPANMETDTYKTHSKEVILQPDTDYTVALTQQVNPETGLWSYIGKIYEGNHNLNDLGTLTPTAEHVISDPVLSPNPLAKTEWKAYANVWTYSNQAQIAADVSADGSPELVVFNYEETTI